MTLGDEFYLMEKVIRNHGTVSYLPRCDVKALVHTESEGMSSRERKIEGENRLFAHKKEILGRYEMGRKKKNLYAPSYGTWVYVS